MEIIDYLRIAKRRWWILVLVPVLAAGLAAATIFLQPTTYTATATVNSGSFVGNEGSPFTGTQGVAQYVGAFTSAAANPQTRAAVKTATGVGTLAQADSVTVAAIGASSDLQVVYTGTNRNTAPTVVSTTARQALALLFAPRATEAAANRERSMQAVKDANAAIAALASKYKIADPPRAYQAQLSQVGSLEQQQANLRAAGNTVGAAALDAPIATAKQVLAGYLPILAEYNDLAATQTAAVSDLTSAQTSWRSATSLQAATEADGVIYLSPLTVSDRTSSLVSTVAPVFAAGIFLAVILVMLIEVTSRVRRAAAESRAREALEAEESVATRPSVELGKDPEVTSAPGAGRQASTPVTARSGDDPESSSDEPAAEPSYR